MSKNQSNGSIGEELLKSPLVVRADKAITGGVEYGKRRYIKNFMIAEVSWRVGTSFTFRVLDCVRESVDE
jgi:hypothetical protein